MPEPEKPRDHWTDEEFIAAFGATAKKLPWPHKIGRLQRPGWSAPIDVYLIWCRRCRYTPCQGFTVTYPGGHEGRLRCAYCHEHFEQKLPVRRVTGALQNPFSSPRLLLVLILLAILVARFVSAP